MRRVKFQAPINAGRFLNSKLIKTMTNFAYHGMRNKDRGKILLAK